MNSARPPAVGKTTAGKTRSCPRCKATILDSASICPACQHHLRFDPDAERRAQPSSVPLKVEGRIRHPQAAGTPWEYSVVLAIRNDRGEEVTRKVVGVGALQPAEEATFTLSVEVFAPRPAPTVPAPRTSPSAPGPLPSPTTSGPTPRFGRNN